MGLVLFLCDIFTFFPLIIYNPQNMLIVMMHLTTLLIVAWNLSVYKGCDSYY